MTYVMRSLTAAAVLAAAAPAMGQTLLLDVPDTVIPLAATLDNPCTLQPEAIVFKGSTTLAQRVWLMPDGNVRLQFAETTTMEGSDATAGLLTAPVKYTVSGFGMQDLEFVPDQLSVLQYKKVAGTSDDFHSVLVLDFDPQNLKLDLKLEGACDNGMP
jgi:hypothetical protein